MLELYTTPALPDRYVAKDSTGQLWMVPAAPLSPEVWDRRTIYYGNYILTRCAEYIERFYQPTAPTPAPAR
jgi:hypothetical protein